MKAERGALQLNKIVMAGRSLSVSSVGYFKASEFGEFDDSQILNTRTRKC